MFDIQVIDDPAAATVALGPTRSRLLSELAVPASAFSHELTEAITKLVAKYHDESAPGGRASESLRISKEPS